MIAKYLHTGNANLLCNSQQNFNATSEGAPHHQIWDARDTELWRIVSSGPNLKKGFISQSYDTTRPTNPFELSKT
jgi:hypothetical protein